MWKIIDVHGDENNEAREFERRISNKIFSFKIFPSYSRREGNFMMSFDGILITSSSFSRRVGEFIINSMGGNKSHLVSISKGNKFSLGEF